MGRYVNSPYQRVDNVRFIQYLDDQDIVRIVSFFTSVKSTRTPVGKSSEVETTRLAGNRLNCE